MRSAFTRRGGLALVIAGVVVGALGFAARQPAVPFYSDPTLTPNWNGTSHRAGAFTMRDQRGALVTDRDLAGRVYVASFIYTRCSVLCPALIGNLKRVAAGVTAPGFRIVSFSVTPDVDTSDVLASFGRERGIDPDRWHLLTGEKTAIYALARDSYFADDARLRESLASTDAFLHTEKLVLVDQQGRLRGVYDGTLPRDIELLIADARALMK